MKYKGLDVPETFKTNGFEYKLFKYKEGVAMYEQINNLGEVYGYEVHLLRMSKARHSEFKQSDGKNVVINQPDKVKLASNEEFGTYGWSYATKESALKAFDEGKGC